MEEIYYSDESAIYISDEEANDDDIYQSDEEQ